MGSHSIFVSRFKGLEHLQVVMESELTKLKRKREEREVFADHCTFLPPLLRLRRYTLNLLWEWKFVFLFHYLKVKFLFG